MKRFVTGTWLLFLVLPSVLVLKNCTDGAPAQAFVRPLCTTIECVLERNR